MRNIENTAVNDLVAQASMGRRAPSAGLAEGDDDPDADPAHLTLPVGMPVAAPFETRRPTSPYPIAQRGPAPPAAPAWQPSSMAPEFLETASPRRLYELASQADHERLVPTFQMRRGTEVRSVVGKLVFPIAVLVSIGIVVGAYVAFGHDRGAAPGPLAPAAAAEAATSAARPADPAPAPPVAALPAAASPVAAPLAAAPVVAAAAPVEPAPSTPAASAAVPAASPPEMVDVRIDSIPSGATVMLVDRGRTQLIGDTPVATAVDPSREYDLVFTSASAPPHVEHFDPRTTRRVEVAIGAHDPEPPAAEPAPRRVDRAAAERAPVDAAAVHTSRPRPERTETRAEPRSDARAEAPVRQGTLMISAKPPCEIVVDGRITGLTTPQRSIALAAGSHRITLVNSEKSIRKVVNVQIIANTTAKIIEDLMP